LIEKARRLGWESVNIGGRESEPGFVIQVDGRGRYSYERTVLEGLRERVICDGTTLWHLYDELGIGARRVSSRFHRAGLRSMIPSLLPSPDELARGANVKRIAKRTVAITPNGAARKKDTEGKPLDYLAMHLVFAKNGRLKERRLLLMPEKKTLARLTIKADGSVKLLDADDKVLAEHSFKRTPSAAPNLEPRTEKLVVLPLPYRSAETVMKRMGRNANDTTYTGWNESDALELIASDLATGNLTRMLKVIRQRFIDRADRRIGFSVLAASRFSTLATVRGAA
jgi:hypothetical protein